MAFKLQFQWIDKDTNTAMCSIGVSATDINIALDKSLPIANAMQDISDCALIGITASIKHTTDATSNDAAITSNCGRYLIIVVAKTSGRYGLLYIPSPDMGLFTTPTPHPIIADIEHPAIAALAACIIGTIDETGEEIAAIVACGLAY